MSKPQFHNLTRFSSKCISLKSDSLTINKSDAIAIAKDYQALLQYTVDLQDQLLNLRQQEATEIELVGPSF